MIKNSKIRNMSIYFSGTMFWKIRKKKVLVIKILLLKKTSYCLHRAIDDCLG